MENLYPDYFKEDDHYSVKVKVAKDPATPPHILEHLSNDDNWMVRSGVALNPNTPPEVLEKLAHSKQTYATGFLRILILQKKFSTG